MEQEPIVSADQSGSAIDRALRLGADALGCPLAFTEAGTLADGVRMAGLPGRSFEESAPVMGLDGARLGAVRALDLASRPDFGFEQRRALADVAGLISADIVQRQRLGQTDHVTNLPNRKRFELDFGRSACACNTTLLLVTLADAKHYNELLRALGHKLAEDFVRTGAEMVRAVIGQDTQIWHVSVLSFVFYAKNDRADAVARELVAAFAEPVMCGTLPITTRIGVGLVTVDPMTARPLETLRSALAAAQDSRLGERGFARYDRQSDELHVRAFRLLTDLDEALRDYGQLFLAYQPRIDLKTGRTVGAEALVRWNHPTLGSVPPSDFIPLSETTAMIGQLTDFVLTRAARQAVAWRNAGLDLRVSVNISPSSLHDGEFLGRVDRILESAGAEPTELEFEFTEGILTSSETGVRATIDGIRERGVTVAIDDFGMGYSNIGFLTRLPADVLKVDRSLVQSIDQDPRRRRLCRAMIELAQDLDFHVVAEGIETSAEYDILTRWRCDEGQGYFMSRPLTPAAFADFANARRV